MEAKIELDKKLTLSVEEASELSGIGLNTIRRMMENADSLTWCLAPGFLGQDPK